MKAKELRGSGSRGLWFLGLGFWGLGFWGLGFWGLGSRGRFLDLRIKGLQCFFVGGGARVWRVERV